MPFTKSSGSSSSRRIVLVSAALLALFAGPFALAGDIRDVISFGDSLSDVGTYRVGFIAQVGGGRFTTNPGPVWVQRVAHAFGAQVTPFRVGYGGQSVIVGGNGYAEGGARVSQQPGDGCNPAPSTGTCTGALTRPVTQQIDDYLAYNGRFHEHQLVAVLAGANDILAALESIQAAFAGGDANAITAAVNAATADVHQAALDLVGQAQRIHDNGDPSILVLTVPAIEVTPFAIGAGPQVQQLVGGLVQLFNGTLATALAPSSAILFDAYPLLRQVEANPGAFGISNITTPACDPQKIAAITNGAVSNGSSLVCSAATLVAPDAARTYLFADGVHPTTVGHAIFAHYVLRALSQHGIDIE